MKILRNLIAFAVSALLCLSAWALTPAQLATLKADITANPDLNAQPATADGAFEIARLYNLQASPTFTVWATNATTDGIFDAVTWTNFTPTDAADGTTLFLNRLGIVNIKQMNLQNMLVGRDRIDCSRPNIRAGLRDAVVALPTGAGGASLSAGGASGATVLAACTRTATRVEKVLSTGSATTGSTTANLLGFEGTVVYTDIVAARQ